MATVTSTNRPGSGKDGTSNAANWDNLDQKTRDLFIDTYGSEDEGRAHWKEERSKAIDDWDEKHPTLRSANSGGGSQGTGSGGGSKSGNDPKSQSKSSSSGPLIQWSELSSKQQNAFMNGGSESQGREAFRAWRADHPRKSDAPSPEDIKASKYVADGPKVAPLPAAKPPAPKPDPTPAQLAQQARSKAWTAMSSADRNAYAKSKGVTVARARSIFLNDTGNGSAPMKGGTDPMSGNSGGQAQIPQDDGTFQPGQPGYDPMIDHNGGNQSNNNSSPGLVGKNIGTGAAGTSNAPSWEQLDQNTRDMFQGNKAQWEQERRKAVADEAYGGMTNTPSSSSGSKGNNQTATTQSSSGDGLTGRVGDEIYGDYTNRNGEYDPSDAPDWDHLDQATKDMFQGNQAQWEKERRAAVAKGNSSGGNSSGGNTSGGNTSGGNTSGGNTSGGSTSNGAGTWTDKYGNGPYKSQWDADNYAGAWGKFGIDRYVWEQKGSPGGEAAWAKKVQGWGGDVNTPGNGGPYTGQNGNNNNDPGSSHENNGGNNNGNSGGTNPNANETPEQRLLRLAKESDDLYRALQTTQAYKDQAAALKEASGFEQKKLKAELDWRTKDRAQQAALAKDELKFKYAQLKQDYEKIITDRGQAAAEAWYKEQQVRLTEEQHVLQASQIGLDYLKAGVEYASSPENYFKGLDLQAGASQRQDVPLYINSLLNGVANGTFHGNQQAPAAHSLTDLARNMGFTGATTSPGPDFPPVPNNGNNDFPSNWFPQVGSPAAMPASTPIPTGTSYDPTATYNPNAPWGTPGTDDSNPTNPQVPASGTGGNTEGPDATGGSYDAQGGYYGADGSYYAPDGSWMDAQGGYHATGGMVNGQLPTGTTTPPPTQPPASVPTSPPVTPNPSSTPATPPVSTQPPPATPPPASVPLPNTGPSQQSQTDAQRYMAANAGKNQAWVDSHPQRVKDWAKNHPATTAANKTAAVTSSFAANNQTSQIPASVMNLGTNVDNNNPNLAQQSDPRVSQIQSIINSSPPSDTNGYSSQDAQTLQAIGRLYKQGGSKLNAGSMERLGKTQKALIKAGGAKLGYDTSLLDEDYANSRLYQGSSRKA